MWHSFNTANYWYILPAVGVLFFSHFLRAVRWRYLLDPINHLGTNSLFSSLMIGYMANVLMPAHLGEFVRAYVLSKKREISMSATFATIVVERIIDVFSLVALMVLAILIHPFPRWVVRSGYIIFATSLGLLLLFIVFKKLTLSTHSFLRFILKPLPHRFRHKMETGIERFFFGVVPLERWHDYLTVGILSVIIWACYALVFYFCLYAFDFVGPYDLSWSVSLVLLAITTVSVVVPSSPGYVGTYHYLCQISLALFGVPAGAALSYATVVHGINILPVFGVGLVFAHFEGVSIYKMSETKRYADHVSEIG